MRLTWFFCITSRAIGLVLVLLTAFFSRSRGGGFSAVCEQT